MSESNPRADAVEPATGEQQIELALPDGRRVLVIARFHFGMNMPVVGPPKPPKGPTLRFPLDEITCITIETEVR